MRRLSLLRFMPVLITISLLFIAVRWSHSAGIKWTASFKELSLFKWANRVQKQFLASILIPEVYIVNPYRLKKGVFAKNERGYRLTAKNKRFWLLLILLKSVASIKRKLLKTTLYCMKNIAPIQIQKDAIYSDRKKFNLIPNNSFRYYNQ